MNNMTTYVAKGSKALLAAIVAIALAFCTVSFDAKPAQAATNKKVAVIYFSVTGTTKSVAKKIQKATNGKLVQIRASQPYTSRDIDYDNGKSRTTIEQNSPIKTGVRPKIKNLSAIKKAIKSAKTIYVGYPIWWGQAPRIMYTLVESVSLKGKKVIPFCTSGGSRIGSSARSLKKYATISKKTKWMSGKSFDGESTLSAVKRWVKKVK